MTEMAVSDANCNRNGWPADAHIALVGNADRFGPLWYSPTILEAVDAKWPISGFASVTRI